MTNKGLRMEHLVLCDEDSFDRGRKRKTSFEVILACAKEEWLSTERQSDYIIIDVVVDPTWVHAHRIHRMRGPGLTGDHRQGCRQDYYKARSNHSQAFIFRERSNSP
jgi:hypothetical protein